MIKRKLLVLTLITMTASSLADTAMLSAPLNSSTLEWSQIQQSVYDKMPEAQQQATAKQWGLTPREYGHYLYLMQQTDNGLYYGQAHLDPSWILAINGKDETERRKFTVLAVQREKARLDKLLAFEKLFQQVQQELYSHQLPIALPGHLQTKPMIAELNLALNDRLLFFTEPNAKNTKRLQELLDLIQRTNNQTKLDIFLVGKSLTNKQIEDWAKQQGIPAKLTQEGVITLNRDVGRYQELTKDQAALPLVLINRLGKFYLMDNTKNLLR